MASEDVEKLVNQGIQAARAGNRAEARRLLEQALEIDDSNEQAWLVLAGVVETPRERRICLENVLEINPNNERARLALAQLQPSPPSSSGLPTPSSSAKSPSQTSAARQPAASRPGAPRTPPPVAVPTKRPGDTTAGQRDAWRSQRTGGRLNPAFLAAVVIALILFGVGLFIVSSAAINAPTPTPTAPAAAAAPMSSPIPTITPTPTLRGTVVPFVPNPQGIPATWTPTPSPTPAPTNTPLPTLPPPASYTIAFVGEGRGRDTPGIYLARGDGSGERLLIADTTRVFDVAWSPDGRRIAFITLVDGREQLAVADADGNNQQVLTAMTRNRVRGPAWSPDGRRIAFSSDETGNDEIYFIDADGTNLVRVTDSPVNDMHPAWSPDGKKLVYASDPTGRGALQIFARDLESAAANPITQLTSSQGQNFSPVWSPDGTRIAFVSTRNRFPRIFVMRADGSDERVLTFDDGNADNRDPDWSPDGQYILFASTRNGGIFNLFLMTPDGKNIQQVTNQAGASFGGKFRPGFN